MAEISSIEDLRAEIARLRVVSKEQETVIRSDAADLREQMKPMNILMSVITSLTGVQMSKSTFVNNGFVFGLSLMIQRLLLKTENQVAEQVHRWTEALISKINDFMSKHSGGSKSKDFFAFGSLPASRRATGSHPGMRSAINFRMPMNGIKRIIPEEPHNKPPARIATIVIRVFTLSLLLTAQGKMTFASRYWTKVKMATTPSG